MTKRRIPPEPDRVLLQREHFHPRLDVLHPGTTASIRGFLARFVANHRPTPTAILQTMETIWASLSANPEAIESPAWHEEELRVREARVAAGEAKFVDWEKAKEEVRQQNS